MDNPVINLVCPNCYTEIETIIWAKIDAATDEKAKNRILAGTLFDHICPSCQESFYLDYPVMYYDDKKKIIIYYENDYSLLSEAKSIFEKIKKIRINNECPYEDYQFYIVKTSKELRKKVMTEK